VRRERDIAMKWAGSSYRIWDEGHLRLAVEAAGVALWSWNVDTDEVNMDERGLALWGLAPGAALTFQTMAAQIDAAHVDHVLNMFAATRDTKGPYEIEFRIARGDETRWVSARGRGADEGIIEGTMFGVFLDVTARKVAEEARELLAEELKHRVKNLFAIASSLTSVAARAASTTLEMERDLQRRLQTLSRAQDLIHASANKDGTATMLGDLFATLLAPYDDQGVIGDRIRVSLPDVRVGPKAATAVALIIHELATNSCKWGALSAERGMLDVRRKPSGQDVTILWTERGGPAAAAPANPAGFGGTLVRRTVTGQLQGSIQYDWKPDGLQMTLRLSKEKLAK
jgi:two-component sensor histidine kinase